MYKKYAMYLRKSRAEEISDTTDETLRKHRQILDGLAEKKNIAVDDIYKEVVSGESIASRPEMLKLLAGVRAGEYTAVLCVDIDRLGRGNMQDQGSILEAFQDSGTLIITPDRTYDLSNDTDEELTEFKAFFARREWKAIRKRMRRGLMQTVEAGGYVANEPYGYRKTTINKKPTLEIVPEEAVFVRHMYDRYVEGTGAEIISRELNAMGSVPRRNAQWSRNTVREILRNPTYKGYIAWNRVKRYKAGNHGYEQNRTIYLPEEQWTLVKGLHKPIISEVQWAQVQDIRKQRYIPSSNHSGYCANEFSGLVYCSKCGKRMQRMGMAKNVPYLMCNTKGCCASTKFEYAEEAIHSALADRLEQLKVEAKDGGKIDTSAEEQRLVSLARELTKLDTRSIKAHEFLEDGTYDRATFRQRLDSIEEARCSVLSQQKDVQAILEGKRAMEPAKAAQELDNLLTLYPTLTNREKNSMLKQLILRIDYTKEKKTKPRDFSIEITPRHFVW